MNEKTETTSNKEQDDSAPNPVTEMENNSPESKAEPSSSNPNKALGLYLKSLREEKKLTLKQISLETRINEVVLKNLEEEKFNQLPRKVYITGFIKNYCQCLNVPSEHALDLLDKVFNQTIDKPDIEGRFEIHQKEKSKAFFLKYLLLGVIAAAFLFLIYRLLFSDSRQSQITDHQIDSKKLDTSTPLLKAPSNIELTNETPLKNPKKEISVPSQKKSEEIAKDITFRPFPSDYLKYDEQRNQNNITDYFPRSLINSTMTHTQKIIVNANSGDTWLAYQKDSDELKQLILKKGKFLVINGNEIRMVLGNSNASMVLHNKKILEIKSKTGIKSLVFPYNSHKKFKMPLFYKNKDDQYVASPSN